LEVIIRTVLRSILFVLSGSTLRQAQGGIVPVRLLGIQVVHGQGNCHVPAWIRPSKGGERCPALPERHSYLCATLFRSPMQLGWWDMSGLRGPQPTEYRPWCRKHRGLLCGGPAANWWFKTRVRVRQSAWNANPEQV